MSLRRDILKRLVDEIGRARQEFSQQENGPLLVVGHGQGSFAHVPATKYKTIDGFINNESPMGMAIVQDSAAQLNRLVIREFLRAGIPAVSLYASNCLVTANRKPETYFTEVFEQYLKHAVFPVTCGDVIIDTKQGCTIWSTEEILSFFAKKFQKKGWQVNQIIHVVEVEGVYDLQKNLIPKITKENWQEVKSAITTTKGFDVTGGMGLKVEESLALAELGITSKIISGLKENNLYNALIGKSSIGTEIS